MKTMRFQVHCAFVVGTLFLGTCLSCAQDQSERADVSQNTQTIVIKATKHASAPPLSQVVPVSPLSPQAIPFDEEDGESMHAQVNSLDEQDRAPLAVPRAMKPSPDPLVHGSPLVTTHTAAGLSLPTNPGLNILGIGRGFPGYSLQAVVPDANLAVGPTQVVQFVNRSFAVFNKSDGSVAFGPASGNTLWQALGAPCATSPFSDNIAQFDKLANRWVMMMPVWTNPNQLCVAVSKTSDAVSGGWNLYAFPISTAFVDYPKLAVWPDAYYVTYDQGKSNVFVGTAVCALDRNSMLNGTAAATMQCFRKTPVSYGVLLPGDLDGTTPPPAGSPDYYLNFDYGNLQSLDLWQFHVDWTTPSNSTFTGPTNIPVAAFTEACGETAAELLYTTGACIPQMGTTTMLDSYGDRLMYRLAYRNFGAYQSLVANHTVAIGTSGTQTGLRWYELRNTGSGFGLYQQGTYAPDSNYRWMGSVAMDKAGDIAMGYSVSSSTMSPSIRYTGRVASDPLGTMEGEVDVLSAAGVANSSRTDSYRWGDYSSIAVDSSDDCTFWYTTQYQTSGPPVWSTRIASFNFPACTQTSTLSVSEGGVGQGTVTSTDGKINCTNGSGTCGATYANGTAVTLNANATTGSTFSGWSGACSGGNPCQVTMNANQTATATFNALNFTLTVSEAGQGTVTSTDGKINCTNGTGTCSVAYASGTPVTLNSTAASGWTFSGWSGPCTGANPCQLVMNSNLNPTANFTANTAWTIVHKTGKGGAITSLTIPATGTGHLLAVALIFNGTTSVTGISDNATGGSNTYRSARARGTSNIWSTEIWYAVSSRAGATIVTPTFASAPTSVMIAVWEVSGISSAPLDAANTVTGNLTSNNTPGAPVTTSQAGDFIVSIMLASTANVATISSGNEFTNDFGLFGNGWAHITSTAAAAGTHQASWFTSSPSGIYLSSTAAFHQ